MPSSTGEEETLEPTTTTAATGAAATWALDKTETCCASEASSILPTSSSFGQGMSSPSYCWPQLSLLRILLLLLFGVLLLLHRPWSWCTLVNTGSH